MEEIVVEEAVAGKRLDEAAFALGIAPSRSKAKEMIAENKILVNNKSQKPSFIVSVADRITYQKYTNKPLTLEAQDIPLKVVYEDDDILIIDKPAGLVVHPGAGHHDGTIVNALLYRGAELGNSESEDRPGIVHRIDKDTSGLLAIAKNDKAFYSLSSQLKDHSMHREYYALVMGNISEDKGKIIAPLGRDPKNAKRYCVDLNGKEAITYFEVLERFSGYTLLNCRLLTGRTHQIRVHMEYIGHPIVGDPVYGSGNCSLYKNGQLLHAHELVLVHPSSGETMTFNSPLPDYFEKLLRTLR